MQRKIGTRQNPKPGTGRAAESPRLARIVEELETIFFAEGFLHLGTEELARRLRCSKQTLYVLAKSREELFALIIERFLAAIRAQAQQAVSEAPDRAAALASCLEAIRKAAAKISVGFAQDLADFAPGQQRLKEHEAKMVALLTGIIESGAKEGVFQGAHPRLAAEVMVQAVARIVDRNLLTETGLTLSQAFGELHNLCLHGLIKPAAAEPAEQERSGDPSRRHAVNLFAFR
ncbi:MAG: TetR/AcrR family transcriptional regulator [Candidatus Binataceae bacterium]